MGVAAELAAKLDRADLRIVFAESCTAGLASARLATVPGVSARHCGSAVTYREQTKIGWLGVSESALADYSAVSRPVTYQMACAVLAKTKEADLAAAITGHLGPNAPDELDGVIFIAIAHRTTELARVESVRFRLSAADREARMDEAAELVLSEALRCIPTTA